MALLIKSLKSNFARFAPLREILFSKTQSDSFGSEQKFLPQSAQSFV